MILIAALKSMITQQMITLKNQSEIILLSQNLSITN